MAAIPLVWRKQPAFWEREAGPLCLGFRSLGIDAQLALLGEPEVSQEFPLVVGSPAQFQDPAWWRQWSTYGVVLYSWVGPRFEPVARAIKNSGAKLALRLDSDGVCSPRVWFNRYLSTTYFALKDERRMFPAVAALGKTLLFHFVPPVFDRPVQRLFEHADRILIESPIARQRLLRLLLRWKRPDLAAKVRTIPAQIRDEFDYDPKVSKRLQILAVGRWDAAQKDAPKLIKSLNCVLEREPEYVAVIAGAGEDLLRELSERFAPLVRTRLRILGRVPHEQMNRLYKESQILFFPSRYEGFPNAAGEALSCGCSVVGPALIAALNYCASHSSGTLACTRSVRDFSDALGAEIEAWREGDRNPSEISQKWRPRVSASSVASRIIRTFD